MMGNYLHLIIIISTYPFNRRSTYQRLWIRCASLCRKTKHSRLVAYGQTNCQRAVQESESVTMLFLLISFTVGTLDWLIVMATVRSGSGATAQAEDETVSADSDN